MLRGKIILSEKKKLSEKKRGWSVERKGKKEKGAECVLFKSTFCPESRKKGAYEEKKKERMKKSKVAYKRRGGDTQGRKVRHFG